MGLAFPKSGPVNVALDRSESAKVWDRCAGLCEVMVIGDEATNGEWQFQSGELCQRKAVHIHHMIFGRGKRAIGDSVLADHKQAVCTECHDDIHGRVGGKKLIRVGGIVPRYTDTYRRVA